MHIYIYICKSLYIYICVCVWLPTYMYIFL